MNFEDDMPPATGEVFNTTSGEKIRVEFDNVYIYRSSQKASVTIVEIGWNDRETFTLDIPFDDFDKKFQSNKKAWREHYAKRDGNRFC